jgi:hypothetical protein
VVIDHEFSVELVLALWTPQPVFSYFTFAILICYFLGVITLSILLVDAMFDVELTDMASYSVPMSIDVLMRCTCHCERCVIFRFSRERLLVDIEVNLFIILLVRQERRVCRHVLVCRDDRSIVEAMDARRPAHI